ncbi:MAG: ribonuclease D, partial [Alphaproteobacteria bacterium]
NKIAKKDIDKSSRYTDWSARPLTDKQLAYALSDVTYLRTIYEKLRQKIEESGRTSWIEEEHAYLTDPALYEIKPEDAWKRLKYGSMRPKGLAVLRELAAWREVEAKKTNVPRGHIIKDDALIELAHSAPTKEADIKRLRRVGKNLSKSRLDTVLKLVKSALELSPEDYPKPEKPGRLPPDIAGSMELLKMLLKVQAEAEGVSASIIAGKDDLESIALGHKDSPALSGWRYDIFGQKAEALMAGKLSLSLDATTKHVMFEER